MLKYISISESIRSKAISLGRFIPMGIKQAKVNIQYNKKVENNFGIYEAEFLSASSIAIDKFVKTLKLFVQNLVFNHHRDSVSDKTIYHPIQLSKDCCGYLEEKM